MNNIPYKEALELKELGFDEKTDVWRQHGEGISGDVEGKKDYWNRKGVVYTALPTYSQAFRWFRDKYGLAAVLDYFNDCKWTYKIFEFTNTNMTPDIHQGDYSKERTYEEAEHDCLVGLIRFAKMNMKQKFRIKPFEVEAIKFTLKNLDGVKEFTKNYPQSLHITRDDNEITNCILDTPKGQYNIIEGDWIIKDDKGEFYVCNSDVFDAYYETISK